MAAQRKSFLPDQQPQSHSLQMMITKSSYAMLRVWSSSSAVSRLEKTEMAMLILEGSAHQLVTLNGQVS